MSIQNVNGASRVSHATVDSAKAVIKTLRTSELPYNDAASNVTIRTTSDGGLSAEPNGRVTKAGDDSWSIVVNGLQFLVSEADATAEVPSSSVPSTTVPAPPPTTVPAGTTSTQQAASVPRDTLPPQQASGVPRDTLPPQQTAGVPRDTLPPQQAAGVPRDTLPPKVAI